MSNVRPFINKDPFLGANHKQKAGILGNVERNIGCFTFSSTFFLLQKISEFPFLKTWRCLWSSVWEYTTWSRNFIHFTSTPTDTLKQLENEWHNWELTIMDFGKGKVNNPKIRSFIFWRIHSWVPNKQGVLIIRWAGNFLEI